jgi:signal transduction histidine kinase
MASKSPARRGEQPAEQPAGREDRQTAYPALVTVSPTMDDPAEGPDAPATAATGPSGMSARVAAADLRALERRRGQARRLRLLTWPVLALVVLPTAFGHPQPDLRGAGLVVVLCLIGVLAATSGLTWAAHSERLARPLYSVIPLLLGASGIGLMQIQESTSGQIAASFAVSVAFIGLPLAQALGTGGVLTAGLVVVVVAKNGNDVSAAATVLLCVTLALMALLVRRSWEDQAAAERLTAQLQDAREEHAKSAALAERGRIARDLHDVLAQSLSGLAIQLEAARRLAARSGADEQLTELLARASVLAKDGLSEARRAVAVLRGDVQASLDLLPGLIERYRKDLRLDVGLEIRGPARELAPLAGEALLRGAQEALTNTARYARGSTVRVELEYLEAATVLRVQDTVSAQGAAPGEVITGSGLGLRGMAERLAQVGGQVQAGPTGTGWLVRMEVPA